MSTSKYVRFFEEFGIDDVPLVGGKNASLGEMFQKLSGQGVRVPHGFAITAAAYRYMLDEAGAWDRLHAELDDLDPADVAALARKAKRAREIVYGAGLPDDLAAEILDAYRTLQQEYGEEVSLAVRSSATAEDLPTASFAGQQDSYLNIKGDESLLDTCRRCFASLFTDRAIHYRIDQGFDHFKVSLSIGVMKMVRSDISVVGCDVLPRHRVGLPRRRLRDGRLRPRRERGSGRRRSRRVLCPQADLSRRPSRRVAPPPRRQGREDDPRRGRDEEHDAKHPHPKVRPRSFLPHR